MAELAPTDLPPRWRAKAELLRPYAPAAAEAYAATAWELECALAEHQNMLLNTAAAARECGYSAQHLRRLIREGRLHNYGRKNAPLVRRGELPKKVMPSGGLQLVAS
jgi:hypothetical protein